MKMKIKQNLAQKEQELELLKKKELEKESQRKTMLLLAEEIEKRLLSNVGKVGHNPYFTLGKLREAVANEDWKKVLELQNEEGKI